MTQLATDPPLCAGYAGERLLHVMDGTARYRAVEQSTGRPVQLKVVVAAAPAYLRDAVAGEAVILAALGAHPNIVTLYQRTQTRDGCLALVLERCVGTFAQLFGHVPAPVPQAIEFMVKVAAALETAHRGGVLHCGVGPQNLLLTDFSEPVLANFESAVVRSDPDRSAPLLHHPTPHTPPELLFGDPATEATDVYGLASTLYWLITGREVFRTYQDDSPAAISARVLCGRGMPRFDGNVPPGVSDLLEWGLAREPNARPPSPIWFAEELGRIQQRNGWTRTPLVIGSADVLTRRRRDRRDRRRSRVAAQSGRSAPLGHW